MEWKLWAQKTAGIHYTHQSSLHPPTRKPKSQRSTCSPGGPAHHPILRALRSAEHCGTCGPPPGLTVYHKTNLTTPGLQLLPPQWHHPPGRRRNQPPSSTFTYYPPDSVQTNFPIPFVLRRIACLHGISHEPHKTQPVSVHVRTQKPTCRGEAQRFKPFVWSRTQEHGF